MLASGLVINKDDGTGEAAAFAKAADIPVLASIPQDDDLRKNQQIIRLLALLLARGRFVWRPCRRGRWRTTHSPKTIGSGWFAEPVR